MHGGARYFRRVPMKDFIQQSTLNIPQVGRKAWTAVWNANWWATTNKTRNATVYVSPDATWEATWEICREYKRFKNL